MTNVMPIVTKRCFQSPIHLLRRDSYLPNTTRAYSAAKSVSKHYVISAFSGSHAPARCGRLRLLKLVIIVLPLPVAVC